MTNPTTINRTAAPAKQITFIGAFMFVALVSANDKGQRWKSAADGVRFYSLGSGLLSLAEPSGSLEEVILS